jgi:hypothetical protein
MNKKWSQSGNDFSLRDVTSYINELPIAVYTLNQSIFGFYLTKTEESFTFNHKIYGLEAELIDRVERTWKNTAKNLGILLNGLKGTGKTVTAKMICNTMKMPVILVNSNPEGGGIPEFISTITQDCVVFIDEYEKIFGEDSELLTVMDGVLSSENRKLFLLTTNRVHVNENLLQRPSRIRYLKTFKDLSPSIISEILDDVLLYPEFKEDTAKFITNLEIITIDVVKTIIEEVNIHKQSPEKFKDVFNVKKITGKYTVYQVIEKEGKHTETIFKRNVKISPRSFDPDQVGDTFYLDGSYFGNIQDVLNFDTVIVKPHQKNKKPITFRIEAYDSIHTSYKFYQGDFMM